MKTWHIHCIQHWHAIANRSKCLLCLFACLHHFVGYRADWLHIAPVVNAENNHNRQPRFNAVVGPILSRRRQELSKNPDNNGNSMDKKLLLEQSPKLRSLPFLTSSNSRKAAQKAYLLHLENELQKTQRQLYISQNACTTLRKRWEDQRRETLVALASGSLTSTVVGASDVEKDQKKIQRQEKEIEQLHSQLKIETLKYEKYAEQLYLLEEELHELRAWKDQQNQRATDEEEEHSVQHTNEQLLQYEQQLKQSHQQLSDYEQQVQLLTLKLEAAELAAKHRKEQLSVEGEVKDENKKGDKEYTWERRAHELTLELAGVRTKYSKLFIDIAKTSTTQAVEMDLDSDVYNQKRQQQIGEEMDQAIQSAVQSALEATGKEWEMKHEVLQRQLTNVTHYATSLLEERNVALSRLEEALSTLSKSYNQQQHEDKIQQEKTISKKQQSLLRKKLTKELTEELTNKLTEELTEKLTAELTLQFNKTLTDKIEQKYRRKYEKWQKEQSRAIPKKLQQQQQQEIQAEIEKVRRHYEFEYASKLKQLQQQSDEQVKFQKERMRKLVRALLEREAKQKHQMKMQLEQNIHSVDKADADHDENSGEGIEVFQVGDKEDEKRERSEDLKTKSSPNKKKTKVAAGDGSKEDGGGGNEDISENISSCSMSSSRRKKRSKPGAVPFRGNASTSSGVS